MPDPEIKVPERYLETAMNRNPDGWGIMAIVDGFPITQKGGVPTAKSEKNKKTKEDLQHFLDVYDFFRNVPHAIHFRIQTHGNVDEENCHPYAVGSGTYLMHNGSLSGFSPYSKGFNDKSKSDTWNFSQTLGDFADKKWLRNESFVRIINILAGETNRLLFMDKHGFMMPRPDLWYKKDGVFYSNNHGVQFEEPKKTEDKFRSNEWKPHGHDGCGSYPRNRNHNKTSDDSKNLLVEEFDQNKGHKFFLDGRRVIQLNSPPEDISPIEKSINPEPKKLVAITDRHRMTPKEVDERLEAISFMEHIPKTPEGWKNLSLTTIRDLIAEEPEMLADAVWELVHQ